MGKIHRTAVFPRTPISLSLNKFQSCRLCSSFTDCLGNQYSGNSVYSVLHVDKNFEDWDTLESLIWDCKDSGKLLRLIIDKKIPKNVLWASSYDALNILQVTVNMLELPDNLVWIRELIHLANNCGLYVVLFLNSIVPTVVKTYQVIDIMDMVRNCGHHNFAINFAQFERCKSSDGFVNFNGHPVPTKYLEKTKLGWKCSQQFIEDFVSKINCYVIPRKVSMSVCGTLQDCTGLGDRHVTKN